MTAAELRAIWGERDNRYAAHRVGLHEIGEDAVAGVRAWRLREANEVEPLQRGAMTREAAQWTLPPAMRR